MRILLLVMLCSCTHAVEPKPISIEPLPVEEKQPRQVPAPVEIKTGVCTVAYEASEITIHRIGEPGSKRYSVEVMCRSAIRDESGKQLSTDARCVCVTLEPKDLTDEQRKVIEEIAATAEAK